MFFLLFAWPTKVLSDSWQGWANSLILLVAVIGAAVALWKYGGIVVNNTLANYRRYRTRRAEDMTLRELMPVLKLVPDLMSEFKPNGGGSMRDATNRLEAGMKEILGMVSLLGQRQLASHNLDHQGKWETDAAGMCRYVNPAMAMMAGRNVEEFFGLGWKNAIHPDDLEDLERDWSSAVRDKRDFTFSFRYLKPNGNIVPVKLAGRRMFDEKNEVIGWFGTTEVQPITVPSIQKVDKGASRLLWVDDSLDELRMVKRYFKHVCPDVDLVTTPTPGDGIQQYHSALQNDNPFDAVILDFMMPDQNGGQVAEAIRAQERAFGLHRARICICSGAADSDTVDRDALAPLNIEKYVTKPYQVATLADWVGACSDDGGN